NRGTAENIARRQADSLIDSKTQGTQRSLSLIKGRGRYLDESITLAGVLLGGRHARLLSSEQFDIEVVPTGTVLITRHDDKPGVISAISAVLGNANINISRMEVSTADDQNQAMAVISVSKPLTDDLLQQLCSIEAVYK